MIAVEELSKSFAHQVLFEKISFKINQGERVGLVGKNGHGNRRFSASLPVWKSQTKAGLSSPKIIALAI
jgi:ATPase components of ABC transporters with duplicated ATPase domains